MRESIQNKCIDCQGSGYKLYGSTATWHKYFIAGQAMTWDICDKCWGSGDSDKPWRNLRLLEIREKENARKIYKLVKMIKTSSNKKEKSCPKKH